MSWFNKGYDGIQKEEARLDALKTPNRLWIKPGTGKDLVLVDDDPLCIYEHNAKINKSWRNHHTCNRGFDDPCNSCEELGDKSRTYTGYLSLVDCSLWEDDRGNRYQYEVKLAGGKLNLLKKWRRKKSEAEGGTLCWTKWRVHREGEKSPSTGDEWECKGLVTDHARMFELANFRGKKLSEWWDDAEADELKMKNLQQVFQLQFDPEDDGRLVRRVVPFNYMEVLKPRGNAFSKELLRGVSRDEALGFGGDSDRPRGKAGDEEDIPF